MLISYVFRGVEVDIEVTDRREPYEWRFYGMAPAECDALGVTTDEEMAIAEHIGATLLDHAMCAGLDD